MKLLLQGFVILLLAGVSLAVEPAGVLKFDAVELVHGREVTGKASISTEHYRFRYLFVKEANKVEFVAHPEKYEIQLGGACGRMGALSGLGKPELFTVHNSRIYIFASESCRSDFIADPARVLARPDPVAFGSAGPRKKGLALIEKAVESMGGAARVDAVKNYQRRLVRKSNWQGKDHVVVDAVTIQFPDHVRSDHELDAEHTTKVLTKRDAWVVASDGVYTLHPQQREVMAKQLIARNLMAIVQARHRPGFVAVHADTRTTKYDGKAIELEQVIVMFDEHTCTLGIDGKTGRILTQSYRGRGPRAVFGTVERTFTKFETIDGITYPKSAEVRFDGELLDPIDETGLTIAFNTKLAWNFFHRPPK